MAKTEVILTHNIVGLGGESDQVKVAAGYARNFLFPQRLAIPLTMANKRRLEALRQRRAEREAHEFNTMSELAKGINKLTCVVKVKTGDDGKVFGSVTNGTIADELKHQFEISLDKKKIHLDHPIKTLGDHDVELRLHADVKTILKVRVESLNPPPTPVETPEGRAGERGERGERGHRGERGERGPRTEKRGRRPEGQADAAAAAPAAPAAPAKPGAPARSGAPKGKRPEKS
jgi:large subunit ribosomal protein L9